MWEVPRTRPRRVKYDDAAAFLALRFTKYSDFFFFLLLLLPLLLLLLYLFFFFIGVNELLQEARTRTVNARQSETAARRYTSRSCPSPIYTKHR